MRPADDLIRVTCTATGSLVVGRQQSGRGAWLCQGSRSCLDAAVRRHAFGRALRQPVTKPAEEALRDQLFPG